ncbi:MAG: hypothetical protein OXG35_10415, partial [Acidobacteria bacterium]|nr:hypothetical protein [Acidobacteriota bacterium]
SISPATMADRVVPRLSTGTLDQISPAIAVAVADLPDSFHRDPADRILAATAQVLGAKSLTQDRRIIAAGPVDVLR